MEHPRDPENLIVPLTPREKMDRKLMHCLVVRLPPSQGLMPLRIDAGLKGWPGCIFRRHALVLVPDSRARIIGLLCRCVAAGAMPFRLAPDAFLRRCCPQRPQRIFELAPACVQKLRSEPTSLPCHQPKGQEGVFGRGEQESKGRLV